MNIKVLFLNLVVLSPFLVLMAQNFSGRERFPGREHGAGREQPRLERSEESGSGDSVPELSRNNTTSALEQYSAIAAGFAAEKKAVREVRFHRCRHIKGETLAQALESFMTPAGTVAANEESDTVVITDVAESIDLLMEVAEQLDKPVSQVLVEVRIIEFSIDRDFQKEINLEFQRMANVADIPNLPNDYMSFVGRLTGAFVDPGSNPLATRGSLSYMRWSASTESLLTSFVRFLETNGRAKILSAPNLILLRGSEGSIITGEEVPIQTQTITSGSVSTSTTFKSVGIKLRISPIIVDNGKIRLQVNPEVSNVTRYDEKTGAPIIAVRSANTELELGSTQLVSIGGLLRSEEAERERRVPILASIPILGHLFRGTSRTSVQTQLVIFLRATILGDDIDQLPAIRNLELPPEVQQQIDLEEQRFLMPKESVGKDVGKFFDIKATEKAKK
ncbi:MAG: hypothetical protein GX230_00995 [Lentisphaerae bacterium]|nr:hypothetical protein [Lentisphaerota bacterium]